MLLKFLPIEIGNAFRCKQCVGQGYRWLPVCVCMCDGAGVSTERTTYPFLLERNWRMWQLPRRDSWLNAKSGSFFWSLLSSVSGHHKSFSSSVAMPFRVSCCIFMRAKLCSITFFIMNNGYKMPEQNKSKGGTRQKRQWQQQSRVK